MGKTYDLMVNANDGNVYKYTIDPSGMLANYSSISTDVNIKPIEGIIKIISKIIIDEMINKENEVIELDKEKWNYKMMLGKYFDNEGIIYYNLNEIIYPFKYSSNYLSKHFNEL